MSWVNVIFFDAAGTLFHVQGSVGEVYLRYAEPYGVKQSPAMVAAVQTAFVHAFRAAPPPLFAPEDPAELKRCERLWWFDLVHSVFYRVGMFEGFDEYFEDVYQGFEGSQHWRLYPETVGVLRALKATGVELGIISNFDTRLFSVLRGLGIAEMFDTVTISSLARAVKPSSRIFQAALSKHMAEPEEALHIGDSLTEDVQGASNAGMPVIWVNRPTPGDGSPKDFQGPQIPSLEQLPKVLGALMR